MIQVTYFDFEGASGHAKVNEHPDSCPFCGNNVAPQLIQAYKPIVDYGGYEYLEIVYKCTNGKCRKLFIGYFSTPLPGSRGTRDYYTLDGMGGRIFKVETKFPEVITNISPNFPVIYNQALTAEEAGLNEICGPGYRRALEFLVKDYVVHKDKSLKDEVESEFLGETIKKINDDGIKTCAKRAVWLGNDETHYVKKFEDKDISDLKKLIEMVTSWIVLTENTEEIKKSIQPKTKKAIK